MQPGFATPQRLESVSQALAYGVWANTHEESGFNNTKEQTTHEQPSEILRRTSQCRDDTPDYHG